MTCAAAPVALRLWHDTEARYGSKVTYAGIVASASHSADCHPSGHNCASTCGGQESPIDGKSYDPAYAHALDIHFGADKALGRQIANLLLQDPRTRYVIIDGVGYYGVAHGYPGTFESFDHTEHVHWSGMPETTFDTSPFYPSEDLTIMDADTRNYLDTKFAALAKMGEDNTAELHAQEQRHNASERARDKAEAKRDADLEKRLAAIEAKL